ncbi:MAG: hypothetical protein FWE34_05015 [Defluviitaleaceae bacterium]|nr:hypothetical protein [Defluviitaleaceae bacterium]
MSHKYNKDDDYKRDIRAEAESHGDVPPHYPHTEHHTRRPSRFWLLMLSFLPGLSHIYLGLIRRGLFYISALAFIIFITSMVVPVFGIFGVFTGFAIVAIYAVSFFEAFSIRRDIIMGKEVKDAIPTLGLTGGSKTVLIVMTVMLVIAFAIHILARLPWYGWLILGVVAVCYAPTLYRKKSKKDSSDESSGN